MSTVLQLLPAILDTQNSGSITWLINNTDSICGLITTKLGDPKAIETNLGKAVLFDGINDGLIIDSNPLEGADSAFTIEVVFKPDPSYPNNIEQRFIHFQEPANKERRVLIELRLTEDNKWYLDTFIKSENSKLALMNKSALHPVGKWFHVALVYDKGCMRHYVNGVEEISGNVEYLPINAGRTSIGTRMDKRSWFKGSIKSLTINHQVLLPSQFKTNHQ